MRSCCRRSPTDHSRGPEAAARPACTCAACPALSLFPGAWLRLLRPFVRSAVFSRHGVRRRGLVEKTREAPAALPVSVSEHGVSGGDSGGDPSSSCAALSGGSGAAEVRQQGDHAPSRGQRVWRTTSLLLGQLLRAGFHLLSCRCGHGLHSEPTAHAWAIVLVFALILAAGNGAARTAVCPGLTGMTPPSADSDGEGEPTSWPAPGAAGVLCARDALRGQGPAGPHPTSPILASTS